MANLLLLDVENNELKELECEGLDDYYKALNCDCIDIVSRSVGKKYFDLIIDDEGLLKQNPIISAINNIGNPMLVGNIIFAKHDSEGNTIDLEEREIKHIKKYIQRMYTINHPEGYKMLTNCEY